MRRGQIRISRPVLVASLTLVGIIFLLLPDRITDKFHDIYIHIFSPVLKAGPEGNISALPGYFSGDNSVSKQDYDKLLKEKDKLEKYVKELVRTRNQIHEWLEQATGVRERLPDVGPGHIWADVITKSMEKSELDINRGRNDSVKIGQYVIGNDNVIGTISQVFNYTAKVKLLTDVGHRMIAEVEGKDGKGDDIYVRAFIRGDGRGGCRISEIKTAYKIKKGNFVYAYARPGYLNAPLVIGKVSSVKHQDSNPLFWDIEVEVLFNPAGLERVFSVTMEPTERGQD